MNVNTTKFDDLKVYAIVITETQDILTPASADAYARMNPKIGFSQYISTKKVYLKLGHAKTGLAAVDAKLQPFCSIAELGVAKIILDGKDVIAQRNINTVKRKETQRVNRLNAEQRRIDQWQARLDAEKKRVDENRSKMFSR